MKENKALNKGRIFSEIRRLRKFKKEIKQKIEQGTLIELPCAIGSIVYLIDEYNMEVIEWYFSLDMLFKIGKTVFLTKSEAKAKLSKY